MAQIGPPDHIFWLKSYPIAFQCFIAVLFLWFETVRALDFVENVGLKLLAVSIRIKFRRHPSLSLR